MAPKKLIGIKGSRKGAKYAKSTRRRDCQHFAFLCDLVALRDVSGFLRPSCHGTQWESTESRSGRPTFLFQEQKSLIML